MSSGDLASGLLFLIVGLWLLVRTWAGGLPRAIARGVLR
jgi:hypothetical protein